MNSPPPQILDYNRQRPRPTRRWQRIVVTAFWIYPLLLPASFNAAWLAAWAFLGYRPHPRFNDPWQINWVVSLLGYLAVAMFVSLLFLFGPAFIIGGILQEKWSRARERTGKYPFTGLELAALYIACLLVWLWDPFGALKWLMNW